MYIPTFFLLTFLLSTTFCFAASHSVDDKEALFAPMQRAQQEWMDKVDSQGDLALEEIREDASFKLISAWNHYREVRIATRPEEEEGIPTGDEMLEDFLTHHKTEPAKDFIASVIREWTNYIHRLSILDERLPHQEPATPYVKRRHTSSDQTY